MKGKRAHFPFGHHAADMAVKACADKLARELELFGDNFGGYDKGEAIKPREPSAPTQSFTKTDITKFTSKKGKVAAKSGRTKYQFQIMEALGIPKSEIHRFADAYHWFTIFSPGGTDHLTRFGLRADWRKCFVTTDANDPCIE
jgi:leucyl-tRNA synthetase